MDKFNDTYSKGMFTDAALYINNAMAKLKDSDELRAK